VEIEDAFDELNAHIAPPPSQPSAPDSSDYGVISTGPGRASGPRA
jgi:hypothetical protein